jgi:hypothetical protein
MKYRSWLGVLALMGWAGAASGQIVIGPTAGTGGAGTVGRSFGSPRHARHSSFAVYLSNSYGMGNYSYPFGPSGMRVTSISISVFPAPPQLGNLPPGALNQGDPEDREPRIRKPEAVGLPQLQPPPAEGAKPDDPLFRRRVPQDREKLPEPVPLRREKQELKPADEVTGLVTRGQKAFAMGEYARAERCFQLAGQVAPGEAVSFFFLAQAQFAMGKYQEAVENIQAGLRLDPHWPLSPFQPGKLYEGEPGEFTEQLRHLAEVLGRFPDDPFLLFLMGYQLWFDGKPDEARQWFARAAALTPDKAFLNLFIKAKPKESKAGS